VTSRARRAVDRILARFRRSDAGTAAVEMALILPLLAILALGVSEFGRIYFAAITVADAARAGAQYGAQNTVTSTDSAAINQAARNEAADIGAITASSNRFCRCPDGSSPTCTGTCTGYGSPEVFVRVSTSMTVTLLMRYPGMPATIPISRTATFRVQ
jgi:Flp pilus assembly protein TadG